MNEATTNSSTLTRNDINLVSGTGPSRQRKEWRKWVQGHLNEMKRLQAALHSWVRDDDAYEKPDRATPAFAALMRADTCAQGAVEALKEYVRILKTAESAA